VVTVAWRAAFQYTALAFWTALDPDYWRAIRVIVFSHLTVAHACLVANRTPKSVWLLAIVPKFCASVAMV